MKSMPLHWKLEALLKKHTLNAYRVAKESGIGLTTIYKIKNNKTQTIQGKVLDNLLQTLLDLTGQCYDVGDVVEWYPDSSSNSGKQTAILSPSNDSY